MQVKCKVSAKENSIDAIRYAAYSQTADCWVMLSARDADDNVEAVFNVKDQDTGEKVQAGFLQELKDEKIREKSASENIYATEFILNRALKCSDDIPEEEQTEEAENDSSALTPEQEMELDALIAEVESELAAEMGSLKKEEDPQNITKTWEEMNKDGK